MSKAKLIKHLSQLEEIDGRRGQMAEDDYLRERGSVLAEMGEYAEGVIEVRRELLNEELEAGTINLQQHALALAGDRRAAEAASRLHTRSIVSAVLAGLFLILALFSFAAAAPAAPVFGVLAVLAGVSATVNGALTNVVIGLRR